MVRIIISSSSHARKQTSCTAAPVPPHKDATYMTGKDWHFLGQPQANLCQMSFSTICTLPAGVSGIASCPSLAALHMQQTQLTLFGTCCICSTGNCLMSSTCWRVGTCQDECSNVRRRHVALRAFQTLIPNGSTSEILDPTSSGPLR